MFKIHYEIEKLQEINMY